MTSGPAVATVAGMQRNGASPPRSYRVPIAVLSVVLFLLLGAIVVVVSARAGRQADQPCAVGEWDVTSYRDAVYVEEIDATVTFTGGTDAVLRLRADGTGETDYGAGVSFEAAAPDGREIRIDVSGIVHFTYALGSDGSVVVTPAVSPMNPLAA